MRMIALAALAAFFMSGTAEAGKCPVWSIKPKCHGASGNSGSAADARDAKAAKDAREGKGGMSKGKK